MMPPIYLRLLWCLLCATLATAVLAAETVLYRANWETGADGWTVAAPAPQPGVLCFGAGATRGPRVAVTGAHILRLRYSYRKSHDGTLTGTALQITGTAAPHKRTVLQQITAPFPNTLTQEALLFVEPQTTHLDYLFELAGPAAQRVTLTAFEVVDLGPPPAQVERKELLTDPGWERYASGFIFPPENNYNVGWMGWNMPATIVCTGLPSRVHGGRTAVMIRPQGDPSLNSSGFRTALAIATKPVSWYDFSVWAKGEGTISLHAVGQMACETVLLSPDAWRQVHMVYPADSSVRSGFAPGVLVNGRVCVDDFSITQVPYTEVAALQAANTRWARPALVAQSVPAGETRTSDPVTLENAHLKVVLSPQGGGRVVALTDKDRGIQWTEVGLLHLVFRGQPVPVRWDLPFRTDVSPDRRAVTFSHQATGGAAVPFLDGILIEQLFRLGPDDRRLHVTYRLTNTSDGSRLPNPAIENRWSTVAGVARVSAAGEEGVLAADGVARTTRNLAAGWMAASTAVASLVWGFDVAAVREGQLDPVQRVAGWSYLTPTLSRGGVWETSAWVAAVPLARVDHADAQVAVHAQLTPADGRYTLAVRHAVLGADATTVSARVTDYSGAPLAAGASALTFIPTAGRFITNIDVAAGARRYSVELFNDPGKDAGISGSGELQYRPTLPIRVLRLPDIGDQRALIRPQKKVLWAFGLYAHYYPFDLLLPAMGYAVEHVDAGGIPEEVEELLAYRVVIIANAGAVQITPGARAALVQYVRAGGSLLVTGGSMSLGNAQSTGTDLEALLPATLAGPFDVQPLSGPAQLLRPVANGGFATLDWQRQPRLYWLHRLTPRPGAKIMLTAGERPVLLEGPCGRGRTLLFAGTVEGDPAPGQLPVWEWSGWGGLWEGVLRRLLAP